MGEGLGKGNGGRNGGGGRGRDGGELSMTRTFLVVLCMNI